MSDRLWITWETQRRNRTLSSLLNAKLFECDLNIPGWRRYPVATWKTLATLVTEKPRIIFAQNPSIVLAWLAVTYAFLSGKKVIIDAHNAGLFPAEGKYRSLNWLAAKLLGRTTTTIVSNDELRNHVEKMGGNAVSIPDPIPEIIAPEHSPKLTGDFNILFICSWAEDEPYNEVLKAAALLNPDIYIYMTGNSRGKEKHSGHPLPENVVLTGYIADDKFNGLLYGCDAVMVLTTRDNCLLCGAYEGVSAGKPLLLSNTRALRNYFCKGALYIENTADSIADNIAIVRNKCAELEKEAKELKDMRRTELSGTIKDFESKLRLL